MTRALLVAGILAGLVAACAVHRPSLPEAGMLPPAGFPEQDYRQAAARGVRVYRVDPASSSVVILVRRSGSLARLGHDHVVASHDVQGWLAPAEGRADLYARLDRLVVDEPELRAAARLETQPTEDDIAGTRRNMLNALGATEHPFARVGVARGAAVAAEVPTSVAIELNGISRTLEVPVRLDAGVDEMTADGELSLRQTDFGITPLSVLGGALQVEDAVLLRFRIRARRIE
jgi:hypothetical protein